MDKGAFFGRRLGVLAALIVSSVFAAAAGADAALPQRSSLSASGTATIVQHVIVPNARCAKRGKLTRACSRRLQAALTTTDVTLDKNFLFTGPNACTGVPVVMAGVEHTVLHMTVDGNGGIHEVSYTMNAHASGTNTVDGGKYSAAEQIDGVVNIPSSPANEVSFDFRYHVIRAAETPTTTGFPDDFFLRDHIHMTTNANGDVTASFDKENITAGPTAECR